MILDATKFILCILVNLTLCSSCKEKYKNKFVLKKIYSSYSDINQIYRIDSIEVKFDNSNVIFVGAYIKESDQIIESSLLKMYNFLRPTNKSIICFEAYLFRNNYPLKKNISEKVETEKKLKKYIRNNLKFYIIDNNLENFQMVLDFNTQIVAIKPTFKGLD